MHDKADYLEHCMQDSRDAVELASCVSDVLLGLRDGKADRCVARPSLARSLLLRNSRVWQCFETSGSEAMRISRARRKEEEPAWETRLPRTHRLADLRCI